MSSTAQQMRAWTGPTLLTYGFRPFFFGAGIWAALAMALWVPMLSGHLELPTRFDPVSWHAHEFLYGYLSAVVAGFLLTSVPNWTGRLPIVGWPLGGLFALWIAGRLAVAFSSGLPVWLVACIDLSMLVTLAAVLTREIVAGKNWRNLVVLLMLGALILGNAVYHWEAAQGAYAAQGFGLRIGLGAGLMLIAVIGGRIVPSFTRNWLVRRGGGKLPAPPMQTFDKLALLALLLALVLWIAAPDNTVTGLALLLAGGLHLVRLSRWAGERSLSEPLLWVLHLGYGLLPVGAILVGLEALFPGMLGLAAAQHVWMAGTIGLMTLAVMTRATLGHTGQALQAGAGTTAIYLFMLAAMLTRLAAGVWPMQSDLLLVLSGLCWLAAFGGFALLYGRLLLRPMS
ncbi:NnrS family protein [Antarcticimicrobium sediminis]|uniref:NnrS family protein n=1 Tax=Antarcticimicrobium sediminis TaxID=2546227 RepID=A0A4R5F146_9RHOB|nr:NnrS family protein [Antarcticimicrobium sediminis]TDE41103.1 NnrS family protein [Antarcticimicrobium sediminis]